MAENQMVAGADTFLEVVNRLNGGRNEVFIRFSDRPENEAELCKLSMRAHNQYGATYTLSGDLAESFGAVGFELWICNVTHDVMENGEHPRNIYIYEIK